MPFPSLIMGLIRRRSSNSRVASLWFRGTIPLVHTVTKSTAHIKGSKTGVHTISQDRVTDEGEDTEEEIDRFTFATEPSAQPSSSAPARGPDRLDHLLDRVEQMYTMLDSHMRHTAD